MDSTLLLIMENVGSMTGILKINRRLQLDNRILRNVYSLSIPWGDIIVQRIYLFIIMLIIVCLAACPSVQAEGILYENYNSFTPGSIDGQGGWSISPLNLGVCDVTADEIYSGGGNAIYSNGTDSQYNLPGKAFPQPLDVRSVTTYISTIVATRGPVTSSSQLMFGLANSNGNDEKLELRVDVLGQLTVTGWGGYENVTISTLEVGKVYCAIAKITPNNGNIVRVDFGLFDITTGGLLDESNYTYQVENFIFDQVPDIFSHVYSGHRVNNSTSDNLLVSDEWADIQLLVPGSSVVGAYDPYPQNGADDAAASTVLSWSVENNDPTPVGYDVYFGTSSDFSGQSPVSTNQPELTYDPYGTTDLDFEETYYWRIDAYKPDQTIVEGDVWSFTIMTNPCINTPPVIDGPHTVLSAVRKSTSISVTVYDDGKPYTGGCDADFPDTGTSYTHVYQWTQQSGPVTAVFSPASADQTNVSVMFPAEGTYELLFEASDGPVGPDPIEGKTTQWPVTVEVVDSLDGDVNIDWNVDLEDLLLLALQWVDDPACSGGDTDCADFDSSGGIDITDFSMLSANWGHEQTEFVISEFMASNDLTLKDNYDNRPDWLEISNISFENEDLEGWHLTDDPNNLDKWTFPPVVMGPAENLIVYASGKNKADAESPLHTNFKLDPKGEYLALVTPEGKVASELSPGYPIQVTDISYGLSNEVVSDSVLVDGTSSVEVFIPQSGTAIDDGSWTQIGFDTTGWTTGGLAVGYDTATTYDSMIQTDVESMRTVQSPSVYIRIPFEVSDPENISSLLLRMKYDDGFTAYINGVDVARTESLTATGQYLPWNAYTTLSYPPDENNIPFSDFSIQLSPGQLHQGTNILAIHGFNDDPTSASSDLLFYPELHASSAGSYSTTWMYMYSPTPGTANIGGASNLGAIIRQATESMPSPTDNEGIVVTAKVEETGAALSSVNLYYRVMYGGESVLPMVDDGTGDDVDAGDGIYTATIPSSAGTAGEMVRWRFVTQDDDGVQFKLPTYLDTLKSPEYFGTVIHDATIISDLDVFHWFTNNLGSALGSGAQGSVFFKDQFYDNMFIRRRAQSSGISLAGKYCLKFDFNPGHGFYYNDEIPSAGEINMNNNKFDKSLIAQILGMRAFELAGATYSICDAIHTRVNAGFYAILIFVEHPEDDYLERNGLDDFGALYKEEQSPWNDLQDGIVLGGITKKTRHFEGYDDVIAFGEGVRTYEGVAGASPIVPLADRRRFVYDNVDIAQVTNYTAAMSIIHGNDHHAKNCYLYRDTDGTGLWWFLPWDLDLSHGHNFASLNNNMYSDELPGGHPLWACSDYPRASGADHWNGLIDIMMDVPELRQMHLRRLRTLMGEILQPPGLPREQYQYEAFMDDFESRISSTLPLEESTWEADYTYGGATYYPPMQLNNIEAQYLGPRRVHLFNTHNIANYTGEANLDNCAGIPDAQTAGLIIDFGVCDVSPLSGNQDEEYITLTNNNAEAVDISNWTLSSGVEHTFTPGTVIPAGYSMFVSPHVPSFLSRAAYPTGGYNLFVQGNYKGHLSSWGETIELRDDEGTLKNSVTTPVNPSHVQRYLRITEIMYHPAAGGSYNEEEYEFIELKNIGLSPLVVDGVQFTDGIEYEFPVSTTLAAGEYALIVKNQSAFESRYGTGYPIIGQYTGSLSNSGEEIKLNDPVKGTILQFDYEDTWYSVTDGGGYSLVVIDPENSDLDSWDMRAGWRPSGAANGSPGTVDVTTAPAPGSIIINETLAHSDFAPNDWIELHNTTDAAIYIGGWFLSDSDADLYKYEIPPTSIDPNGYAVFTQDDHFGGAFALSENSDDIYLTSPDGYSESQSFGASESEVAFGQHTKTNGGTDFVAMSLNTPGNANAYPKVGPIIIRSIMYHPPDNDEYEYIELYNTGTSSVNLFENVSATNVPWSFTNGVDYTFPTGVSIPAGDRVFVVENVTAFMDQYPSISSGIIYGPYDGQLSNGGEKLQLSKPGEEIPTQPGEYYNIRVEMVNYSDGSHPIGDDPWPTDPDGNVTGTALVRKTNTGYCNDYINWEPGTITLPESLLFTTFDSNADGFTYADDTFGTSNPSNASGSYSGTEGFGGGGGLTVYLGPGDAVSPMSGGWFETFTLSQSGLVRVTLHYRLTITSSYENNEYGEAILRIDGTKYGNGTNDSLVRIVGTQGTDSGWVSESFDISLSAGSHTLTVGAYNNDATQSAEWTEAFFDNIKVEEL